MPVETLRHKTLHRFGQLHAARSVRRPPFRTAANTQAPEPVIRASPNCASQSRYGARLRGSDCTTTGCRSFRPVACGKGRYFDRGGVLRVNSGAAKICGSRHLHRRHQHHIPRRRHAHRVKDFAHAFGKRALTEHEHRHVGAELQGQLLASVSRGRLSCHRRLSASRTVAASELPPPRPPPIGRIFSSRMLTPAPSGACACSRRAARTVRSWSSLHAGQIAFAYHPSVVAQCQVHGVGAVDQAEHALQQVVAVGTPADDVQEQIELGGGGIGVAHSTCQLSATRRISRPSRATTSLRGRAGASGANCR